MLIVETNKEICVNKLGWYTNDSIVCVKKLHVSNIAKTDLRWLHKPNSVLHKHKIQDSECISIYDLHVMIW